MSPLFSRRGQGVSTEFGGKARTGAIKNILWKNISAGKRGELSLSAKDINFMNKMLSYRKEKGFEWNDFFYIPVSTAIIIFKGRKLNI